MTQNNWNRSSKTFKIAFGGICLALTIITVGLASFVPGIELTLFAISSLFTAIMILETGVSGGIFLFAGASLLGLLILPNKMALIPYIFCFGYYAILKFYIEKIPNAVGQIAVKTVYFGAALFIGLYFFKELLASSINMPDYPVAILIIGGLVMAILYDFVLTLLINYYVRRFKSQNSDSFKLS